MGCGCNAGSGGAGAGYTGRPYRAAVLAAGGKADAAAPAGAPRSRWLQWVVVGVLAYLVIR